MWSHRRLLAVLVTALLATTLAYLVVRDPDPEPEAVETSGESATTTTSRPTTSAEEGRSGAPYATTAATGTTLATTTPLPTGSVTRVPSRPTPVPTAPASTGCAGLPPVDPPSSTFAASTRCVTAGDLGSSWRPGCPVGPDQLRAVDATHWGYDGAVHTGRVIVAANRADGIVAVLQDLFDARFPIERMEPVDRYGGDDHASMVANNTSAFNCRTVSGTARWSEHAYGQAMDVNPLVNPYVQGDTVDPPEGADYADREPADTPGMIHDGDAAVTAFARQGWQWGGYWTSGKDYQHFSTTGR